MPKFQILLPIIVLAISGCGASANDVAQTMVAETKVFEWAMAIGIATGIASTKTAGFEGLHAG